LPAEILPAGASLSRLFRGKLVAFLRQAFTEKKLKFCGKLADLGEPAGFDRWLRELKATEWVVYAKPPFGGRRTF
jgi:hypothetical protein